MIKTVIVGVVVTAAWWGLAKLAKWGAGFAKKKVKKGGEWTVGNTKITIKEKEGDDG